MKNTDFSYEALESMISSEDTLNNLIAFMEDMDLEIMDVKIV